MRRHCEVVLAGVVVALGASSAGAFSIDDIQLWAGQGSNRAAFVVQWHNAGPSVALAWGYRWDGTATAEDMILALAGSGGVRDGTGGQGNDGPIIRPINGADPRLFAQLTEWDFGPPGTPILLRTVFGIGYDADGDGFTYVDGPGETGQAADPDDLYYEGWSSGYYWGIGVSDGGTWASSNVGLTEPLADGTWIGNTMIREGNWDPEPEDFPLYDELIPAGAHALIPEPATLVLVGLGVVALGARVRRRFR